MELKRSFTSKFSFFGAFIGLIFFILTNKSYDFGSFFIFISTILYFSLLALVFSTLILLFFSKVKVDRMHFGAIFGYIFYLVASILIFVFNFNEVESFFRDVVFYGPIPGFILQICLMLLGILLGLYLSNTDIVRLKVRK